MASIHQLTDAPALGHLLVVVLVERFERRSLALAAHTPGKWPDLAGLVILSGITNLGMR